MENSDSFSFGNVSNSVNSSSSGTSEQFEPDEELVLTQEIELKEINNRNEDIIILAKVKEIKINNGIHNIKICNSIENLQLFGGKNEIIIRAQIDNIIICGGQSNIYILDLKDVKINKINIKGGQHKIHILSYVHKLDILGGNITINCNYLNSKIDKIISIGGTRDIYLNNSTDKCIKNYKGGVCNFHVTDIEKKLPINPEDSEINFITPTKVMKGKEKEICTICLNNYKKIDIAFTLPCKHIFHVECLKKWFEGKKDKRCPNCKFKVINSLLKFESNS